MHIFEPSTVLLLNTLHGLFYFSNIEAFTCAGVVEAMRHILAQVWGGSKGVINFPWIFLCDAEFSPCWALPEYIRALGLVCGSFR